ncbi:MULTISPECIES: flagellar assembly protein FliH [Caldimonas]|uniref:FliH/SctL family protein n=1 Tax=Caldimonas TaxID=196013 RepID=UPI001FDFF8DB|nr:flagellar assembly protein FliH [Caldimonas manganoxidans]MCX7660401.1 flagellar assembly protein FliH [Caldimonas manganoxidans]GIX25710.1 MAG: flagellar assembly protein FliH [Caldimonas sp.]
MATPLYSRFIPREELHSFSAWSPDSFSDESAAAPAAGVPPAPQPTEQEREAQWQAQIAEARQAGYKDGYRDGLVALDGFKQSYATQVTAQVAAVAASFRAQLDAMEQQLAQGLSRVAVEIARQVVRSELSTRPELIQAVAQEALNALVHSARHIRVRLHPDDYQFLTQQGQLDLDSRGARLVSDPDIRRGGCIVESDIGLIDASLETRWRRAAAALGHDSHWQDDDGPTPGEDST